MFNNKKYLCKFLCENKINNLKPTKTSNKFRMRNSDEEKKIETNTQENKIEQKIKKEDFKLNQIIRDEEEESVQDKYKDFTKTIKDQEAVRRKEDVELNKLLNNSKFSFLEIPRIILQRNFLKRRKLNEEENKNESVEIQNKKKVEINIELLTNLNLTESITLYEIDLNTIKIFKSSNSLFKMYFAFALASNVMFALSFEILFHYTKYIYNLCYLTNTFAFITYLFNKKIKNKVLTLEYIHNEKSIKITKWKLYGSSIEENKILVEDLEMFYSPKYLEQGVNLRLKTNPNKVFWIGVLDEGIWHNKELFENLFGKIHIEE